LIAKIFKYWIISFIVFSSVSVYADSLWKKNSESLFTAPRSNRIGDVITIFISESSSALQEADTNASKQSSVGANFFDSWDQVAQVIGSDESVRKTKNFKLGGEDKYAGTGKTSRKSKLEAVITAVVTEVLANGNLYIVGERNVKVNDEIETIYISGIVRPSDITPENTINSSQIARAEISLKGSGVVGSKQTPGVMTKFLNWLF